MSDLVPAPESKESAEIASATVTTVGSSNSSDNHIYIYDEIDEITQKEVMQKMIEARGKLMKDKYDRGFQTQDIPVVLHIFSPGGLLFTGFALFDFIRNFHYPTVSIIEGLAASAATLISIACEQRIITPSGFMLIHQASGFSYGKFDEMKDDQRMRDVATRKMTEMYQSRSKLTLEQVQELLRHESWMSAEEALEAGFVDVIS